MSDVNYLKVNLFFRIFHPICTTGILPAITLIILNLRMLMGIHALEVNRFSYLNIMAFVYIFSIEFHPFQKRMSEWNKAGHRNETVTKPRNSKAPKPRRNSDKFTSSTRTDK